MIGDVAWARERVQVIGQSDAMAISHLVHLMLAVAVECCPLNRLRCHWCVPVIVDDVLAMFDRQLPAIVTARKTDD